MKVVFLIIYFWEVKTISQDKSMNLDGSLDDDEEDEKKVELLLLSLCVMVWKLSLLGADIPMSFSAATRKLEKILFTINCSLHNVTFITIHLPISCQDSRRLKSIYITWSNNLKTCRLCMVEDLWPKTWKEGECYHFGRKLGKTGGIL